MCSGCSAEWVLRIILKSLGFRVIQKRILNHRPKDKSIEESLFFSKSSECMGRYQGLPKKELFQLLSETSWIEIIVSSMKDLTVKGNNDTSASYVVILGFTLRDLIHCNSCPEEWGKRLQYQRLALSSCCSFFLKDFLLVVLFIIWFQLEE